MSDYDYRPSDLRGSKAMDYDTGDEGSGIWTVIGVLAVLGLIVLIAIGSSGTVPDESAVVAPAKGAETTTGTVASE